VIIVNFEDQMHKIDLVQTQFDQKGHASGHRTKGPLGSGVTASFPVYRRTRPGIGNETATARAPPIRNSGRPEYSAWAVFTGIAGVEYQVEPIWGFGSVAIRLCWSSKQSSNGVHA
jgi:hypothetical protein